MNDIPNNDFDFEAQRVDDNDFAPEQRQRILRTVLIRKPRRDFFRCPDWDPGHYTTWMLEVREGFDSRFLQVDRAIVPELTQELPRSYWPRLRRLYPCLSARGVLFLWPVPGKDGEGKLSEWSRSAFDLCEVAKKEWVQADADTDAGYYEPYRDKRGRFDTLKPRWPVDDLASVLKIAFKASAIDSLDHPAIDNLFTGGE